MATDKEARELKCACHRSWKLHAKSWDMWFKKQDLELKKICGRCGTKVLPIHNGYKRGKWLYHQIELCREIISSRPTHRDKYDE